MTILLAIMIDLVAGDPPNRWHPVAWLGRLIGTLKRYAPAGDEARLRYGAALTAGGAVGVAGLAGLAEKATARGLPGIVAHATLLKMGLAWHGLASAAEDVGTALQTGNLEQARHLLGWHLVSRDTSTLDAGQLAGATIESLAENLSDSFAAPLLYYSLGGLPALWAYRFVNTADAMIGYRDAQHAQLGKVAARTDDAFNFVPARITALSIALAARLLGEDASGALHTSLREHTHTDSPNAGWPMSAMAGALGVSLEKVDHYTLGDGPAPHPTHIDRSLRIAAVAAALIAMLAIGLRWLVHSGGANRNKQAN